MSTSFKVVVVRCCYVRGVAYTPGAELDLQAAEVQPLLDCLRAELADAADMPALREALAAEFAAFADAAPVYGQKLSEAFEQLQAERTPRRRIGFLD
jgi:hypothetical protein